LNVFVPKSKTAIFCAVILLYFAANVTILRYKIQ